MTVNRFITAPISELTNKDATCCICGHALSNRDEYVRHQWRTENMSANAHEYMHPDCCGQKFWPLVTISGSNDLTQLQVGQTVTYRDLALKYNVGVLATLPEKGLSGVKVNWKLPHVITRCVEYYPNLAVVLDENEPQPTAPILEDRNFLYINDKGERHLCYLAGCVVLFPCNEVSREVQLKAIETMESMEIGQSFTIGNDLVVRIRERLTL